MVIALLLLQWAVGLLGVAAWTQSWWVVRAGHFRIVAWIAAALAGLALLSTPFGSSLNALADGDASAVETAVAVAGLVAGTLLLGGVSNGMLLGHWYLNQPGLETWALDRVTTATLAGVSISLGTAIAAAPRVAGAATEGAVLGLPGFGASFGLVFFAIWIALLGFTGVVVWMAKRCIASRSIQSATGLYYVAVLTAGVAEFLGRYLTVRSA